MTRDDITRMALEAGFADSNGVIHAFYQLERFAALVAAAERNKLAAWMIQFGFATGHGDTVEDLLKELEWQIAENWTNALVKGVEGEREACAKVCDDWLNGRDDVYLIGKAIRARGEK